MDLRRNVAGMAAVREGVMTGEDSTKNSWTKPTNESTSALVLMAPRLARITPVGLPLRISLSAPQRMPAEKFFLISHG